MIELLIYPIESGLRPHITLAGTNVCEDDIRDRYGHVPEERRKPKELWLDPGGFAFSDTEPVRFEISGIKVVVKPEHLYAMANVSIRMLPDTKWVKAYLDNACVVLPALAWAEIHAVTIALADVHEDGRDLLAERIAGIPNINIKK